MEKQSARIFKKSTHSEGIRIHIQLPFCESPDTFRGCNKRITKNHSVEVPFLKSNLKVWKMYCDLPEKELVIKELPLGGGTSILFSAENLKLLLNGIFKNF